MSSLSTSLDDLTFAFLDVETTGLSPRYGDRVCEIAVARSRTDLVQATFQSLVNPQRPISPGAASVNGLNDDDVRDAPLFGQVADVFLSMLHDAVIVCHNARFDLGFLSSEMQRAGQAFRVSVVIDTLELARRCPLAGIFEYRFHSHSLPNVARALGIPTPDAHRALGDALTTREVLNRFLDALWKHGRRTLGDVLDAQGEWLEGDISTFVQETPLPPDLAEALSSGKRLFLAYVDADGNKSERWVTPQQIVGAGDALALIAFCHLREAQRQFRLDRIVRMEIEM